MRTVQPGLLCYREEGTEKYTQTLEKYPISFASFLVMPLKQTAKVLNALFSLALLFYRNNLSDHMPCCTTLKLTSKELGSEGVQVSASLTGFKPAN